MAELPPVVLRPPVADRPFRYWRGPTNPPVSAVIDRFWAVEWELPPGRHHDQEVVTHPCSHVTVEAGQAWVQGVVTHRFRRRLAGSGRVVGTQLRASGLSSLTDVPPAAVTGRRLPAAELFGDVSGLIAAVEAEREVVDGAAAFERWLTHRAGTPPADAVTVDDAVALITSQEDLIRVDDLAAAVGVSVRTLQRRFDRHLGVGPKWVLQRCRIQGALSRIEGGGGEDWADLAQRLGFTDQAHFVNSFTAMVGVPPEAYRRRPPIP